MTQEEKDLLLKDLCGRLPYNVKVRVTPLPSSEFEHLWYNAKVFNINSDAIIGIVTDDLVKYIPQEVETIKPYLFPLSSMTEEQDEELKNILGSTSSFDNKNELFYDMCGRSKVYLDNVLRAIEFFNKHHFDYNSLIERGLAIDCTNLNIY